MAKDKSLYRITDTISVKLPQLNLDKVKTSDASGLAHQPSKIIVTIPATHGGFVNKNYAYYRPSGMRSAVDNKVWTTPYPSPITKDHQKTADSTIGRVIDSTYEEYVEDGTGGDSYLHPENKPSCHINLTFQVTDSDAIAKFIDGRYSTVSIEGVASSLECSICGATKFGRDGKCDNGHMRGQTYAIQRDSSIADAHAGQKMRCFWFMGMIEYDACTVTPFPADEYANNPDIEEVYDSSQPVHIYSQTKDSLYDLETGAITKLKDAINLYEDSKNSEKGRDAMKIEDLLAKYPELKDHIDAAVKEAVDAEIAKAVEVKEAADKAAAEAKEEADAVSKELDETKTQLKDAQDSKEELSKTAEALTAQIHDMTVAKIVNMEIGKGLAKDEDREELTKKYTSRTSDSLKDKMNDLESLEIETPDPDADVEDDADAEEAGRIEDVEGTVDDPSINQDQDGDIKDKDKFTEENMVDENTSRYLK